MNLHHSSKIAQLLNHTMVIYQLYEDIFPDFLFEGGQEASQAHHLVVNLDGFYCTRVEATGP